MKTGWKAMAALFGVMIALWLLCAAPTAYAAEEPMTRAAMAQLIVDTFELQYDKSMDMPCSDVTPDMPEYEAICVCYNRRLMSGTGSNHFDPNGTITRAQAATILYRTGIPDGTPNIIPPDVEGGTWYYDSVCAILKAGIMTTYEDGMFRPNRQVYRSEINTAAIDDIYGPNTTEAIRFDLTNGSISISRNLKGVMVFQQGETALRTRSQSALIQQSNTATPTANTITVESGEVTLSIVDLNVESETSPIAVSSGAELTLTLMGSSTLKCTASSSGGSTAGIQVPENAELIMRGSGVVSTIGGCDGAGIGGGGFYGNNGTITINGGMITATGYSNAAGIGGGSNGSGGIIRINSGVVNAIGGKAGSGIGSGNQSDKSLKTNGGTITISGGKITAIGGYYGAGIGGGWRSSGGNITINAGTVIAAGGDSGSGIGGGNDGCGGTVTIASAEVTANGYFHAIGGGDYDNVFGCDSITISDSAVVSATCSSSNNYDLERFTPYHEVIKYSAFLNAAALDGHAALLAETASGASGLSYQWQESADNANWTDIDGQIGATASIPMSAENDGHYYRCRLTNGWGNVVYTEPAQAFVLAFTQQPQSVETGLDDVSTLSVTASCANVTYQWQRSYDDGVTWTNVPGEIYSTLVVDATLSENDALYRCVITATNGDELASDAARITVNSTAITYTTRYYLERADGTGYDLTGQSVTEASAGANVTAIERTFENFTENTAKGILTGTVKADNSLILSCYYDRDSYSISYETNGGAALGTDSVKYGAAIFLPTPAKLGCTFDGWYRDAELAQAFTDTAMPGENLTLYAKWSVVGAGRGVEYRINGITLRDSAYQSISAIPRGTFYAEVSVTNLYAEAMDTLVLATYDSSGKMLGMSFLYANPQIGQTFVLGTGIDNSKGEVAKIKAFMLPMLGGLTPLAESAELGG